MAIPVYIFANQRSGTNFLRNALVSTGEFTDMNEIFQPNEPAIFWTFYSEFIARNPAALRPTKENRKLVFDEFINTCIENIPTKYALIDLKYNTTHNLNTHFQPPSEAPYIFELLKQHSCHVVHLIRENSYFSKYSYENFLEIGYAELARINDPSEKYMVQKLNTFFELATDTGFEVRTKKIAKAPSEIISNYKNEILPALLNSPYSRFAH